MARLPPAVDGDRGDLSPTSYETVSAYLLRASTDVLKALLDVIKTLPPYYRAVLLMGVVFLLMFIGLIWKYPNEAYFAVVATTIIFMIALLKPPPQTDSALAQGQDERAKRILPKTRKPAAGSSQ